MGQSQTLESQNSSLKEKIERISRTHNLKRCWLCGTNENLTKHHLQMRRKRTKDLSTIPLCNDCHYDVEQTRKGNKSFFKNYYKEEFEKQIKALKRKEVSNSSLVNYWKNKYDKLLEGKE